MTQLPPSPCATCEKYAECKADGCKNWIDWFTGIWRGFRRAYGKEKRC